MRLFLACFLAACSGPVDDIVTTEGPDATFPSESGVHFTDAPAPKEAAPGPVYVGGPLACGKCTCDGTLYACLENAFGPDGGCTSSGPPPPPPPPSSDASADADADADADAGADADASDAMVVCGNGHYCDRIPVGCLPKPTCDCIEKATGLLCAVASDGTGFILECP